MEKHRRSHNYQANKHSYWNVFRVEAPAAPARDDAEQSADRDSESPGAYRGGATESDRRD